MRVVIAGASGFVGQAVVTALREAGDTVQTIGRRGADASWEDADGIRALVDGADALINLAGKSVDCRYTDANRDEILRSRVETTRALAVAVGAAHRPPPVWLNASTATIYRHETERANSEENGCLGAGFSVDVARAWERALLTPDLPGTRRVALRMAIVLGDGPATRRLQTIARLGIGGPHIDGPWFPHRRYRGIGPDPTGPGTAPWHRTRGRQRFSWVHIDDVVRSIRFLIDRPHVAGPVNVAAPHPVDNRELMHELRESVGAPFGLPAHRWMLEPAMWALRTETELVLKSRWVVPGLLLAEGFSFAHPHLREALESLSPRPRRITEQSVGASASNSVHTGE